MRVSGRARRRARDMAGVHQSKGRRGQTFGCPLTAHPRRGWSGAGPTPEPLRSPGQRLGRS